MIPKFRAWEESAEEGLQMWSWKEMCEVDLGQFFNNPKYELMQSTGLKDKNGVEIFEGDVLYHSIQGERIVYYPFEEQVASYGLKNIDNGMCNTLQNANSLYEIIGNIYENPELLEVAE